LVTGNVKTRGTAMSEKIIRGFDSEQSSESSKKWKVEAQLYELEGKYLDDQDLKTSEGEYRLKENSPDYEDDLSS
jgi:hypothetical protein